MATARARALWPVGRRTGLYVGPGHGTHAWAGWVGPRRGNRCGAGPGERSCARSGAGPRPGSLAAGMRPACQRPPRKRGGRRKVLVHRRRRRLRLSRAAAFPGHPESRRVLLVLRTPVSGSAGESRQCRDRGVPWSRVTGRPPGQPGSPGTTVSGLPGGPPVRPDRRRPRARVTEGRLSRGRPLAPSAARPGDRVGWPRAARHRGRTRLTRVGTAHGAHDSSPQGSALALHDGARGGEQDWGAP